MQNNLCDIIDYSYWELLIINVFTTLMLQLVKVELILMTLYPTDSLIGNNIHHLLVGSVLF